MSATRTLPGAPPARPARRGTEPPRLGFVGVGWIGLDRLRALVESQVASPVAVFDPDPERVRAAREVAPGLRVVPDLASLLAAEVDGVVIASPSGLHAAQATACLETGAAVFCQKPLGKTGAETRRAVEAARRADRPLAVDLAYRHAEAARRIVTLAREGALGRLLGGRLAFHNAYGPDKAWYYDAARSGGGCVIDLGIHLVDLALSAAGDARPRDVSARLYADGRPLPSASAEPGRVEDFALVRLEVEGGATFHLECSWNAHAGRDAVIEAELFGTEGGAALRNVDGSFYDFVAERRAGTSAERLCGPPDEWPGRAAVAWARRLAGGEGFDPEAERLVALAEVLDRIYGRGSVEAAGRAP